MPCDRPHTQLYLYLDGELAPAEALAVQQHLHTCQTCQQEAQAQRRLQTLLRTALPEEEVPEGLWASIQHQLDTEIQAPTPPAPRLTRRRLWAGLGAVAALGLAVLGVYTWRTPSVPVVVREIVDSQIRARLMGASYHQLPTDPEAIRHWFADKTEFAVLVPELSRERYAFLGVRLNYFLNRRVAEMAYTADQRVLSFVMFAEQGITLPAMPTTRLGNHTLYVQTYKGYTTVLWKDAGFFCGLVSDLHLPALMEAVREATAGTASS